MANRSPGLRPLARRRLAPDVSIESVFTRVGDWNLHARLARGPADPEAPIVVLVHGLVVSSRYMVPLARELGRDFRVVAPDLPGFGLSDGPRRALDLSGLAAALGNWMEETGIESAALLGNSFGCQILTELAVTRPELVSHAILQGPTTDPEGRGALTQFWRWLQDGKNEPLSEIPILLRDYWDAGVRRAIGTARAMLGDPIEEKLPRVRAPALVVRGALDPIVPQEWAERAARLLPRGRLVVLPGVAHTVNFSAPLELARVVRPFLREEAP